MSADHGNDDALAGLSSAARALLEGSPVARLATVASDGTPHVVPITYTIVGARIYSVVDQKPKRTVRLQRLRNIEANPAVALVVDRYDDDWTSLAWVMVRGEATEIGRGREHAAALEALRAKYAQYYSMDLDGMPMIRLEPRRVAEWSAHSAPGGSPMPRP